MAVQNFYTSEQDFYFILSEVILDNVQEIKGEHK